MLGVKIEDKFALANLEEIVRVPGISFGEGGPGDMSLSFGFKQGDPKAAEVQEKIFQAARAQKLFWLGVGVGAGRAGTPGYEAAVEKTIKEGHMIGSGEALAAVGRKITRRPPPY